jgi:hypothetical protein
VADDPRSPPEREADPDSEAPASTLARLLLVVAPFLVAALAWWLLRTLLP